MQKNEPLRPSRRVFLVVILGVLSMMAPLGTDMYLPGMPTIARDLGAPPSEVQLSLSCFMLGFACGQLVHGPLADSIGRRRVLIWGTLGFVLFSLLCGMAPNIETLVGLRLMQGLGGAASGTVVFALMRDIYDRKEDFARMMSFVGLVVMLAPLAAPFLGGFLLLWSGWRAIFWCLTGMGLLAVSLVWLGIRETLPEEGRPPLRLGGTVRNYLSLLGNRRIVGYILASALPGGGMFAFITAGSFVYIDLYGVSPQHFGFYFGMNILGMTFFSLLNGRLLKKLNVRTMLKAGLAVNCLAGLWLAAVVLLGLGFAPLVAGVVVFVGSIAAIGANAMAIILSDYPHMAGTLSSLVGMSRFGAGALFGAFVAVLPSGTPASMALTMTGCGLGAVASYALLAREPRGALQPAPDVRRG